MKTFKFVATPDGNLTEKKTGRTIEVASFSIARHGNFEVVSWIGRDGQKGSAARYTIDETSFNFGTAAATSRPKADASNAVPNPRAKGIPFTKEELIQVHSALQSAADLTLKKLMATIL
jgi:hypothetical protein